MDDDLTGPAGNISGTRDQLPRLRNDYPAFHIWQETTGERVRYIARSVHPGTSPHTLVTADLGELRAVLEEAPTQPQPISAQSLCADAPNIAGTYAHWLGGKDSFEADRQAADALTADFPDIASVARANRQFVIRAVAYVAAQGISQYMDIGAGLPTAPTVHDTARQLIDAHTCYVDSDPVVLAYARALLASSPSVAVVAGDIRQPTAILTSPELRTVIDLRQPVCVILAAVLHFLPAHDADAIVAPFRHAMAPGSYLILSTGTSTGIDPALISRLQAAYQDSAVVEIPRTTRHRADCPDNRTARRPDEPDRTDSPQTTTQNARPARLDRLSTPRDSRFSRPVCHKLRLAGGPSHRRTTRAQ